MEKFGHNPKSVQLIKKNCKQMFKLIKYCVQIFFFIICEEFLLCTDFFTDFVRIFYIVRVLCVYVRIFFQNIAGQATLKIQTQ